MKAYRILEKQGEAAFNAFCQSCRMPESDREGVRNKYRVVSQGLMHKFRLPEVGTRTNPKVPRPDNIPYREPEVEESRYE